MALLNNNVLSVLTQYIDDREALVLCDVMDYDPTKYIIKNTVDIITYKPSDGVISKVYWDPLLNKLPHTFHVVCRLDDYFKAPVGIYHEVQLDRRARVYDDRIEYRNENGKIHRIGGPAVKYGNGNKYWYENGRLHRIGRPAIEYANRDKEWYENGLRHRIGGPAIELANHRGKEWYENGLRHRIGGPAIELANGKEWYENGLRHRIGGPAIELANGTKWWYENGKRHRRTSC